MKPTEWLICEVMAARTRTGEWSWTFPKEPAYKRALDALAARGVVQFKVDSSGNGYQAWWWDLEQQIARWCNDDVWPTKVRRVEIYRGRAGWSVGIKWQAPNLWSVVFGDNAVIDDRGQVLPGFPGLAHKPNEHVGRVVFPLAEAMKLADSLGRRRETEAGTRGREC